MLQETRTYTIVACIALIAALTSPGLYAMECVSAADLFSAPADDLPEVNLGAALITQATLPTGGPAPLAVRDCSEDGTLDVWVGWSESSASPPAMIHMSPNLCLGKAPEVVAVVLRHYYTCTLEGFDDSNALVASATAAPGPAAQTLTLQAPTGIRRIEITGAETCIMRICWECGEEPQQDDDCVSAWQFYAAPVSGLPEVVLGPVLVRQGELPDGSPVPLSVQDCSGDGLQDVYVPWTEASGKRRAEIFFTREVCEGNPPQAVAVTLRHGNMCVLRALDESGTEVAKVPAAPGSGVQTLVLSSAGGIRRVLIEGSEICLIRICWSCELPAEDCVHAWEYYEVPFANLSEVHLGPVTITQSQLPDGSPVSLYVDDCSGDGLLDVAIPWTEAHGRRMAEILFAAALCGGKAPREVTVTLRHGTVCILHALDDNGNTVDKAEAAPGSGVQTLHLASAAGIRSVVVEGAEICVMEICWVCNEVAPPPERFIRGDANVDFQVDISDGITILSHLFQNQPLACLDAADANDDGQLDIGDGIYMLAHLFASGPQPPPPFGNPPQFGDCGPDLTNDPLDCASHPRCLNN